MSKSGNSFIDSMMNQSKPAIAKTQNDALSHRDTGSSNLDLFSTGVTAYNKSELISNALEEDFKVAIKVVMYLRDCRGGQGNKGILRELHNVVYNKLGSYEEFIAKYVNIIKYIPIIGYWKDVYTLYGKNPQFDREILKVVDTGLYEVKDGLCAKWFPRQTEFHKAFAIYKGKSLGEVRRDVTKLTNVVETKMCAGEWHEINYSHVPSVANKKYSKAFKRNDSSRYEQFLTKALSGDVTMKASQLYPHEILSKAISSYRNVTETKAADALWKNLPNYMKGEHANVLPIIDLSSSMTSRANGTVYSCMTVAAGLGMYFAEHNTGAFKDIWFNFNNKPKVQKLRGNTLSERWNAMDKKDWGGSTNLQSVFDLIILCADKDKPEDSPKILLLVSDMEFDCCNDNSKTNFEIAKKKFEARGLQMPVMVFWRVNTATTQTPVKMHESGTILINGYSPSILQLILSLSLEDLEGITPQGMMMKSLEKYTFVDKVFE